ncbi:cyclin-like protein [Chytridium lagenaria]|nr:cyclin-like protein [Chytridium lagenaria]
MTTSLSLRNTVVSAERLLLTPSNKDGIDRDVETELRMFGTGLIASMGILLRLPQTTIATAQVLLHRYYFAASFKGNRIRDVVLGALFLASKVEECPRKIRDIVNMVDECKEAMIGTELRILCLLGFNVHVQHPHGYMISYLKGLGYLHSRSNVLTPGSSLNENKELSQTAWNYLNDSARTILCVCFQPHVIAAASVHLATRKSGIPLPSSPPWWELFDTHEDDLHVVSSFILSLYEREIRGNIARKYL